MRFSLIVCTLGRCNELMDLLDSLVRQNRSDFEVIVVDQNTDDRLVGIVARFLDRIPLKHIRMKGTGASRARNIGLDYATGDLIGFPDDDCRYLNGYLDAVDQIFTGASSICCITGYPTAAADRELGSDWQMGQMDLNSVTVLNRCQEFTLFVRRQSLCDLRYNERLGVGAQTLWGADEAPDLLIRLVKGGERLVFFPRLFVYHPNKIETITRSTLERALSYSRGRGCLFRLHHFPLTTVLSGVFRPTIGCGLYLLKCQPMRSAYYFAIVIGTLRGLLMSKTEFADVRNASNVLRSSVEPTPLRPLPPQPLVSVLVANYNYARFLPAALDALLGQTYSNWHAIVCDDGSTDDSVQVIAQYANRDPRVQLVRKSNGGQNSAFNACYEEVRGEIICLLDADDVFDPRKIQRVVESFLTNPQAGVSNHYSLVIDEHGHPQTITMHRVLDSGWLANKALTRGACVYAPTTSCMSIRREIGDIMFPIPRCQDRDLDGYVAMVSQFLTSICVINEQLSNYRVHANNMGGLTVPTLHRLRYELQLIERRTSNVEEFVEQRFGEKVAGQIVLEDNPQYIQATLKLFAIERADARLPQALALIRRHPSAKWRAIWRVIFTAPEVVRRNAIPWMHRSYRVKAVFHRLIGCGKVAST